MGGAEGGTLGLAGGRASSLRGWRQGAAGRGAASGRDRAWGDQSRQHLQWPNLTPCSSCPQTQLPQSHRGQ